MVKYVINNKVNINNEELKKFIEIIKEDIWYNQR